jgi:hypothetical protein
MAVIERVDWTDNTDISKGSFLREFNLTSWDDGTTLDLAGGRYESLNGFAYKITGGDFSVDTSPATTDGTWYIHIVEDGVTPGNAIAYLDSNAGIYRGDLGGFYYDVGGGRLAKVWGVVEKVATSFNNRTSINYIRGDRVSGNLDVGTDLTAGGDASITGATSVGTITVGGGLEIKEVVIVSTTSGGATTTNYPTGFTKTNTILLGASSTRSGDQWIIPGYYGAAGYSTVKLKDTNIEILGSSEFDNLPTKLFLGRY